MTITDEILEEEHKMAAISARRHIGMELHSLITTEQAAVMRSVVRVGIVWIDANGIIRRERRTR